MPALVAGFDTEEALSEALRRFPAHRWPGVEVYSPVPLDAPKGSRLPALMFAAGMAGFGGFFWLMAHADTRAYPLDVGGRPDFAWPAFVPIAFELAVLCAMTAGFVGFFVACRMPRLYRPIDESRIARRALCDTWILEVPFEGGERLEQARALLEDLAPTSVEEIPG